MEIKLSAASDATPKSIGETVSYHILGLTPAITIPTNTPNSVTSGCPSSSPPTPIAATMRGGDGGSKSV
jgi:hypothetical protein